MLVVGADNLPGTAAVVRERSILPGGCSRTPGGRGCWICVLPPEPAGDAAGTRGLMPGPRCSRASMLRRCTSRPTLPAGSRPFTGRVRRRGEVKPGERRGRGVDVPGPEVAYNAANDQFADHL